MTDLSDFYQTLLTLAKSYEEKNTMIKIDKDVNSDIIRIFGENITSLSRAKLGIDDVAELAYATAEHHPFWSILYQCSQISKTTLEKWNDDFTKEQLDEIEWSIKELKNTLEKLKQRRVDEQNLDKDK